MKFRAKTNNTKLAHRDKVFTRETTSIAKRKKLALPSSLFTRETLTEYNAKKKLEVGANLSFILSFLRNKNVLYSATIHKVK